MKLIDSIKRFSKQLAGLFPTRLPQGLTEFNNWADNIATTYTLPTIDTDSIRFILASLLLETGKTTAFKPKFYFVLAIRAAAAKQVAGSVFYEIKMAQKAAADSAKLAAVTATSQVATIGQSP